VVKWARYIISSVRYNHRNTHILEVEVAPDLGSKFGEVIVWSRAMLLAQIESGVSFVTARRNFAGSYTHGRAVRQVTVGGTTYLRIDASAIAKDNLGNLPEF
jgi:hypothetical protein